MTFEEILDQAMAMLQRRGRVTYRALKLQFDFDDDRLEALKDELLYAYPYLVDDDGRGLVWTVDARPALSPATIASASDQPQASAQAQLTQISSPSAEPCPLEAERRQLTVLFCDLVDSTVLANQLDPEEWREVVRAYQSTCAEVIQRLDGYIAQYLGDDLLVYFGYPRAHEDDAERAVQASLGILAAMDTLNARLAQDKDRRLAVRIGIHTGLVVGKMGGGGRQENPAPGDTPNVAARLQGVATPDTIVISAATHRLVQGYFAMAALGSQVPKGVAAPVPVYRVLGASAAQSRLDVAEAAGWTPLVGRESEVALLLERWEQSQAGMGQVVLLSGEGGIGKSRLVEVLRQRVVSEGSPGIMLRCSPYHTHSALYPVIQHPQRWLQFTRDDIPEERLRKLEEALALAQALAHPQSLAVAQHYAAFLHHRRREVLAVLAQADALLTLGTAQGFPLWVGFGTCWRGWALEQLRQGMTAVLGTGQELSRPLCLILLAEAAGHAGQIEEALGLLAEALTALEESRRGDLLVEAHRLRSELLLRRAVPEVAQVEACLQQALAVARRHQAKPWGLRAAMSLSRLWQRQGKRAAAHELLAGVYGWFT